MVRLRHLAMASRMLAHRFRELHPYEVQASLLTACNGRCVYCRCYEVKTELMTTEQWVDIIRGLGALGTVRIKFQGGEPSLRHDFRELCAEANAAGMTTAATSHGKQVPSNPDLIDYLDELIISLDSPRREVNDSLRGEGAYDGAVGAIDIALEKELRTFVNMVLTQKNLPDLEAMLEFCEARGVILNAQPAIFGVYYYDEVARSLALTGEQIRDAHLRIAEWKRQGRPMLFSPRTYQKVAEWPDHNVLSIRSNGESSCMAGKYYINIEPNGDVLPCIQHSESLQPKNILRDGLEEALRNVRRHDCGDCFMVYLTERKAVFGLKPRALWEVVKRG
jgi:MoaA/NifB/PqqE/SkfB family radical SAM enzyme